MADDDTRIVPPYMAGGAKPATGPSDIPRPPVVASGGDNPPDQVNVDTDPKGQRPETSTEQTQAIDLAEKPKPFNRLDEAGRLLRARGRCRVVLRDRHGCMCVLGAIGVAAGIDPDQTGAYGRIYALPEVGHLARHLTGRFAGLSGYRAEHGDGPTVSHWADAEFDDRVVLAVVDDAAGTFEAVA